MREYFRRKLDSFLEIAGDEGFIQLVWAANALQSGAADAAVPFLDVSTVSREAITEEITDTSFIYKWELETITNEILVTPKQFRRRRGLERHLNTANYNNIKMIVNYLRKLENQESKSRIYGRNILMEMSRIANRQFDWQRGYFNLPQFYRNAYIYGQGACADYFNDKYGITINQMSCVGLCLYISLMERPIFDQFADLSQVGISQETLSRVLSLMSQSITDARQVAKHVRRSIYHTAYRPSVLRKRPCLSFGADGERIRAPLPQLILERVTSGVFYDIVGGEGQVRAEYGKRFEDYCLSYLEVTLPNLNWQSEFTYKINDNQLHSPDILGSDNKRNMIAIECKAARMSYGAKFGYNPLDARGFKDLIKAVHQLWRFFSHSRRKLAEVELGDSPMGIVLTLDNWLTMAKPLRARVMEEAVTMSAENDPEIIADDRRPIIFVPIADLEATIARASEKTFIEAVTAAARSEYNGWMLSNVHKNFIGPDSPKRAYPFKEDIGRLLPWWDTFAAEDAKLGPSLPNEA